MCAVWNWSLPRRDAHPIARCSASTASPNNGRAAGISAASAIVGCRWRRFRAEAESELNSILKKTTCPKGFPPEVAKPVTWRPPISCVSDSSGVSLSLWKKRKSNAIFIYIPSYWRTLLNQLCLQEKMKTWCASSDAIIFLVPVFFSFFIAPELVFGSYAASPEYARHPPRSVIFTEHERSNSQPQQVHISLVGKDHMRISWVTNDTKAQSIVEYGKTPGKYESSATGNHLRYKYFSYRSGDIHHVKIGPLEPSTTYYYRCSGAEPEFSFITPPAKLPIEFAIVGDLGQTEWTASTLEHVDQEDYDVFLLPGDLSYADTQQPLWDSFGRLVEPYASKRPWMVTEGNHEVESFPIIHPKGFEAYNARWLMPYEESGSTSNLYYSFDVAGTHIIMLGSYTDYEKDSEQYLWLQADLAKIDRSKTPWIFVLLHAPWYNSNAAHKGEGEAMRKAMEELLYNARVDVVFAGHVHAYERFTRVYDNTADPCGPVYITIGDGGNREGLAMKFENPAPAISLYREPSFGHGRLRVMDERTAYWAWHRNNESNSVVADELSLQSLSTSEICKQNGENHDEL